MSGCGLLPTGTRSGPPRIEFVRVPLAAPTDPNKLSDIKGRVVGAQPNQRIVLYAGNHTTWWVQPFANQPFTKIQADSTWVSRTHPGVEYAALLVGPDFRPPAITDVLPSRNVIAFAVVKGEPPIWQRWWFVSVAAFLLLAGVFGYHLFRLHQMADRLNLRFEERLAERMRVAQILHDTLLQGVISASMQLHVAADQVPAGSPALEPLQRVLQSMGQVVEEGRNTLRGMRLSSESVHDLERSFSRIPQELGLDAGTRFRVFVKGRALPLQSNARVHLYSIGRDVLVDTFRRSRASHVQVELRYGPKEFRLVVRDDGVAIGQESKRSAPDRSERFSAMRERANRIGASFKVRRRLMGGTAVVLRVPSDTAFESPGSIPASRWFNRLGKRPKSAKPEQTERAIYD